VEGVASVSVLASSGTASDALSTAVFVRGIGFASEAMLVTTDPQAEVQMTAGWKKIFRKE
jgi:thiamine biosynthesis lipoprotein ApbE